jgi:uncharacterized repeat protein (TIGR01451 family)
VGSVCILTNVSNTGLVEASTVCSATSMVTNPVGVTLDAPVLSFVAVKTQIPAVARIGEPVTYQIVVTNTGGVTIETMTVTDTISPVVVDETTDQPVGFGVTGPTGAITGTSYVWTGAGLAFYPATSLTFTITGFAGAVCADTTVTNTAYVLAADACGAEFSAFTNAAGGIVAAPIETFTVSKEQDPAAPGIGDAVTYRIMVANEGTATATSVIVVDTIFPVITAVTTDAPVGIAAPTVTSVPAVGTRYEWSSFGALAMVPGVTYTFTITGTVGGVCNQTPVSNTAFVSVGTVCTPTTTFETNMVDFMVDAPTFSATVAKLQPVTPGRIGEAFSYQIVVTNTGEATIDCVTVVDTVYAVLTGTSVDAPVGFGVPTVTAQPGVGTTYEWSGCGLNFLPGTDMTFTITGTIGVVCVPTGLSNTAYVNVATTCTDLTIVSNGVNTLIDPPTPGMSVVKNQTPAAPGIGDTITYQIVVTNTGTSTLTKLTVSDEVELPVTGITLDVPVVRV